MLGQLAALATDLNIGYRDYSQAPDYFVADNKGKSFQRLENARAGKSFLIF